MKVPFIFLLSCLFFSQPGIAQNQLPDLGAFSTEDFNMKECSFDKTADAVRIFDRATSNYNDEYNLITDRRIRLKILKESGIDRGNIHILFYSKDKVEYITKINAVIATPDKVKGYVWNKLDQKTVT